MLLRRLIPLVALAALGVLTAVNPLPAAAATGSVTDRLSPSGSSIEITSEPPGTQWLHLAVMSDLAGHDLSYVEIPPSQTRYTPPPATPVVDVQAFAQSGPIGAWAGRLQTVPAGSEQPHEEPLHEELPHEEPSREQSGSMVVGVDTGGWEGGLLTEIVSGGIPYLRVQQGAAPAAYSEEPGHIAVVTMSVGPTANPSSAGAEAVSIAEKYHPLTVEVVNEPGNPYFWGSGAQTDQAAYAKLLEGVHTALLAVPAAQRPVELASFDGGYEGDSYGRTLIKDDPRLLELGLGWTVHPYGGHGSNAAEGNRARVTEAYAATKEGVYVTEVGWSTAVGQPAAPASLQYTEAQQAANITSFVNWARGLGYVKSVIIFNGVDYGTNEFYGIETSARKHKLSFAALAAAAR